MDYDAAYAMNVVKNDGNKGWRVTVPALCLWPQKGAVEIDLSEEMLQQLFTLAIEAGFEIDKPPSATKETLDDLKHQITHLTSTQERTSRSIKNDNEEIKILSEKLEKLQSGLRDTEENAGIDTYNIIVLNEKMNKLLRDS